MDLDAINAAYQEEQQSQLRHSKVDIESQISELAQRNDPEIISEIESHAKNAIRTINQTPQIVANRVKNFSDAAHACEQSLRIALDACGEYRKPRQPDLLQTLTLLTIFWTIEAALTGFSLVADGTTELASGLMFGAMFSGANIGIALITGYISRYVDYRLNSQIQTSTFQFKRRLAQILCLTGLTVGIVMIFVAGRVRAVGEHEHIFDFSSVGFFQTFNDAIGLCIMVAGGLSYGVALYKGRNGLTEKRPELAEVADSSREEVDADVEDYIDEALAQIDDLHEDVETDILSTRLPSEYITAIDQRIAEHNADVSSAKNRARIFAQEQYERLCFIEGADVGKPTLDLGAFDALLIRHKTRGYSRHNHQVLDDLKTAHTEASASILQAQAEYLASVQGFRFLPPRASVSK